MTAAFDPNKAKHAMRMSYFIWDLNLARPTGPTLPLQFVAMRIWLAGHSHGRCMVFHANTCRDEKANQQAVSCTTHRY